MYFVIANEGTKLQTGLNILLPGFSANIVDIKNIHKMYYCGIWIRPVVASNDAKIVWSYFSGFAITGKIILGNKFPLCSLKTIKKFNLKLSPDYIDQVCIGGNIEVLEWWKNSGLELKYTETALNLASCCGQVEVLEWWKNSGLELKYDTKKCPLDSASSNGRIKVLKWWKNSGLELKYTQYALDWASRSGHVEVLEWWKNSGLELKYTERALNWASSQGQLDVLEWWKNSGLIKIK
jgi:hypothetical protein